MSIAAQIIRIQQAKSALKSAINARGGALGDELLDHYAAAVTALPAGEGTELSFITASADDILEGKVGAGVDGKPIYGNIPVDIELVSVDNEVYIKKGYYSADYTVVVPTAEAVLSGNVVTIPTGYHWHKTLTVEEMAEPTVSANVVTIPVGYNKTLKTKTIAEAGELSISGNKVTCPAGYVKSVRTAEIPEAQSPTVNGHTVTIYPGYVSEEQTVEISCTGNISGGMKFFKCRSVHAGSKTWDGYEVTFDDVGISSISDTLTTGLTYGAITPLRQNIYSADGVTQIRGALMSGGVPMPFYYVSGETPRGDIWYTTANEYINGDGDNKGFRTQSGSGVYHDLYIDGKYISLPGFPVSASAHDWACAYWLFNTGDGFNVLRIGTGSSGYPSTVFRFRLNQYAFDGSAGADGTWESFTPLFDIPTNSWIHIAVSYNSSAREYTVYVNGEVYTQFVEQTAVERLFDCVQVIGTNNFAYSHLYFFAEQLTQAHVKSLAKQRWIFNGLYVSGLSEVYNEMNGNVSPNGKLVENGTYMFKPKYYIADQYEMSIANVQWNGTQWEIYMDSYDADLNTVKLILATGEGGNDPSEASWTDTGYGLPTVTANYANGI